MENVFRTMQFGRQLSNELLNKEFLNLCEKFKHLPVIVEGLKDKQALQVFGFENIFMINKPLFRIIEELSRFEEVLILTDLDNAGRKLYSMLKSELSYRGVRVNDCLRHFLFRTKHRQVEALKNVFSSSKNF